MDEHARLLDGSGFWEGIFWLSALWTELNWEAGLACSTGSQFNFRTPLTHAEFLEQNTQRI